MKENILSHSYPPKIITYPDFTNLFFAFQSNPQIYNWLVTNIISLYGVWQPEKYRLVVNFSNYGRRWSSVPANECPFIEVQMIDLNLLTKLCNDVIKLVKDLIDNKTYCLLHMDEYYLSCFSCYKKRHFIHDIFVFGYDEEYFYVSSFFENLVYSIKKIPYEEFKNAYSGIKEVEESDNVQAIMLKYSDDSQGLYSNVLKNDPTFNNININEISKEKIKNELRFYLKETRFSLSNDMVLGYDLYKALDHYCDFLLNHKNDPDIYIFHQTSQMVYAHKIILKEVLLLLNRDLKQDVLDEIDKLINLGLDARNIFIKIKLSKNYDLLNNIKVIYSEMSILEKTILMQMI